MANYLNALHCLGFDILQNLSLMSLTFLSQYIYFEFLLSQLVQNKRQLRYNVSFVKKSLW